MAAISASSAKSSGSHGSSNQRNCEWCERLRIGERLVAAEFGVGVDREHAHCAGRIALTASTRRRSSRERQAADLHLHHGVAGVEMAAHLVLQVLMVWPGEYQPPPT